jgi:hypothetical protein
MQRLRKSVEWTNLHLMRKNVDEIFTMAAKIEVVLGDAERPGRGNGGAIRGTSL